MKKKLLILVAIVISPLANADIDMSIGQWSWKCSKDNREQLFLKIKDSHITDLKLDDHYQLINNGRRLAESETGNQIGSVRIGGLKNISARQQEVEIYLEDYSDVRTWRFYLQADNNSSGFDFYFSAALISTFQSSDGDGLLHPNISVLDCKVEK